MKKIFHKLFHKQHYCDVWQRTNNVYDPSLPPGFQRSPWSIGNTCFYYKKDWNDTKVVKEYCNYPLHQKTLRISSRKDPFRKLKIFFKFDWMFVAYGGSKGPVYKCKCLPNCYKLRKDKLKRLNK